MLVGNNTVAKPFQLKVSNRKLIMNVLKKGGAFSIADISSVTGISRQTVTKAIDHFIATKIVEKVRSQSTAAVWKIISQGQPCVWLFASR